MTTHPVTFPGSRGTALAVRGSGVLRFDFTGLGESEGDFASPQRGRPRSHSLDGEDHLLTREADVQYAAPMIATWASRYLPRN